MSHFLNILITLAATTFAFAGNGQWTLIGWNNLGMHCMDDDYSVFTILPPFNTIDAHLIDAQGKLVASNTGIVLTYEAVADPDGSINRTVLGKSNFWDYTSVGYGAVLAPELGLAGTRMPGPQNTPQPMAWNPALRWFEATGVPITPVDDAGRYNPYPLLRLVARNASGIQLAETKVVVPVSSEMDCRACHASNAGPAARPAAGWVNDPSSKRDFRLNILRLHDERHLADPAYQAALAANGWRASGLFDSVVQDGASILCAKCHASEALGTGSAPGTTPLTRAMHAKHAQVTNPLNGLKLDHIANRTACYTCHPGSATRCLRGAMGAAVASDGTMSMQCQSCHGTMSQVGASDRVGWLQEPNCQSCHTGSATQNNGQIRYTSVFDENGRERVPVSTLFATNADTPAPGISLYRFSKGHGGLQCSACHGSTHAEYPASHRNDNLQSVALQGHAGVITDCLACHATMPKTVTGGPHGMHPISAKWTTDHADSARSVGLATCAACHGADYRGTVLSRAQGDRTFTTKFGTKKYFRGREVGCYDCHNGVNQSDPTRQRAPTVANASLAVPAAQGAAITLPTNGEARILRQPQHGSVALNGNVATYFADAGFSGPDSFTYTATNMGGYIDAWSAATVAVSVGAPAANADSDGDGLPDVLEYAIGLSPEFPSAPVVPAFEPVAGQNYLTLTLPRSISPGDTTVTIEVSSDLQTWTPAMVITDTASKLKARDTVPLGAAPRRFIRARATRP